MPATQLSFAMSSARHALLEVLFILDWDDAASVTFWGCQVNAQDFAAKMHAAKQDTIFPTTWLTAKPWYRTWIRDKARGTSCSSDREREGEEVSMP